MNEEIEGILLLNKPQGKTSFSLVAALRKKLKVKKIGHAGTLDPFATGVMVMLIGKRYTRLSDLFLHDDKEYLARLRLGIETDTYDLEGNTTCESTLIPHPDAVKSALLSFQGEIFQIPPMFSAKKINGKKLYELARKGKTIERTPAKIYVETTLLGYEYPYMNIHVKCSKGTYIRSLAYDLGKLLECGAHLSNLTRTRSGRFNLKDCLEADSLYEPDSIETSLRLQKNLKTVPQ